MATDVVPVPKEWSFCCFFLPLIETTESIERVFHWRHLLCFFNMSHFRPLLSFSLYWICEVQFLLSWEWRTCRIVKVRKRMWGNNWRCLSFFSYFPRVQTTNRAFLSIALGENRIRLVMDSTWGFARQWIIKSEGKQCIKTKKIAWRWALTCLMNEYMNPISWLYDQRGEMWSWQK